MEVTASMIRSMTHRSGDAEVESGQPKGAIEYKAEHGRAISFLAVTMTEEFNRDLELPGEIESIKFMQGEDDSWTVIFAAKNEKVPSIASISNDEMNRLLEQNRIVLYGG